MVGGVVIGITRKPDCTTLHVWDAPRTSDTVCVDTDERRVDNGERFLIATQDRVWWQGGYLMVTPVLGGPKTPENQGKTWDIVLRKVGYTHHSGNDGY